MDLVDVTIGGVPVQVSPRMTMAGPPHAFTTRLGGVSEGIYSTLNLGVGRGDDPARVRENYRRVCAALGTDVDSLVFSRQVHRDGVRVVTAVDAGKGLDRTVDYEADGLVTNVPGVTLVVFGSDCLTALLCDPVQRAVGAVHAGWRGTALDIVGRAVEVMGEQYGSDPTEIIAALGPCIGKCCFETNADVPEAMRSGLGEEVRPFLHEDGGGKWHVDLKGINAWQLERRGVKPGAIDVSPDCTFCHPEKYWSHRYTGGRRGSQATLIALPREWS